MRVETGVPPVPEPGQVFDLADPAAYAERSAHGAWLCLRSAEPVRLDRTQDGVPYWSFFSYAECETILKDTGTFSSVSGTILDSVGRPDPAGGRTMVLSDPPDHTPIRAVTLRHLGAKAVRREEHRIRAGVSRLVAAFVEGEHDVMPVLRRLPMAAIGPLLGLPERDWEAMTLHSIGCVAPEDPEFARGDTETTLLREHSRLIRLIDDVVRAPEACGFATDLRALTIGDGPAGRREAVLNLYSVLVGGNTTTPHVAAHLMLRLAEEPGLVHELRRSPGLVSGLVEESVRWTTPTHSLVRRVNTGAELGGVRLEAGDWVAAWVASANRDESVFDEPYEFRPHRAAGPHLGFGRGAHYCAGAWAARLLLRAFVEELLARGLDFRCVAEPRHLTSTVVNGVSTLQMRFFR